MNRRLSRLGLAAVVILAGAVPAMAQAGSKIGNLDFGIKFHVGATAGNLKDDLHAQNMLGLGVEGSYALSSTSAIIGEITFSSYGAGKGYDNTKFSGPVYGTAGVTSVGGVPVTLQVGSSVDYRKNSLQGFSFRGGYRGALGGMWSWQGGLTLDSMKYRQEANGTLQPKAGATNAGALEGIAVTPTTNKLSLGAFAGVKLQFSENFFLETNLVSVGYSTANYLPYSYTGQAPTVDSQARHGILLEVSFGLKL